MFFKQKSLKIINKTEIKYIKGSAFYIKVIQSHHWHIYMWESVQALQTNNNPL